MTLSEIQLELNRLINQDKISKGLEFAKKLEQSLQDNDVKNKNPEVYKELTVIIFKLYVFALSIIPEETVNKILSLNVLEALNLDLGEDKDLMERIDLRFGIYPDEYMDQKKVELLPLLKQNNQRLGNIKLTITIEKPSEESTVKNWLDYYDRKVGFGKNDTFARGKFLTSDSAVQELNTEDKELLRKLLTLYDYLKIGSPKTNVYQPSAPPQRQAQPEQNPIIKPTPAPNNIPTLPNQGLPKRKIL